MDTKIGKAVKKAFGERVSKLRREAGFSQEQIADLADLDRSYIGGVERGDRNISLVNIHKIARALKIKPAILFQ